MQIYFSRHLGIRTVRSLDFYMFISFLLVFGMVSKMFKICSLKPPAAINPPVDPLDTTQMPWGWVCPACDEPNKGERTVCNSFLVWNHHKSPRINDCCWLWLNHLRLPKEKLNVSVKCSFSSSSFLAFLPPVSEMARYPRVNVATSSGCQQPRPKPKEKWVPWNGLGWFGNQTSKKRSNWQSILASVEVPVVPHQRVCIRYTL